MPDTKKTPQSEKGTKNSKEMMSKGNSSKLKSDSSDSKEGGKSDKKNTSGNSK